MNEELVDKKASTVQKSITKSSYSKPVTINTIDTNDEERYNTGSKELDRVLGGGIVKGSLVLLGGDPGIGKSTILLQICEKLGQSLKILYVSGEESKRQLKLRAQRLGVNNENIYIMTETDVEAVADRIQSETTFNAFLGSSEDISAQRGTATAIIISTFWSGCV